ncbi:hypothetical protein FH972_024063 [Carpinus fangiana]|uniref:Uncharacterized protein n=1 Tax=Carpinus fangiana TaxID=176857 RepID=A0A5N6KWZ4_9ROSI|nr:hypothetical protein FH972_024063 [Carpinus fangiana]
MTDATHVRVACGPSNRGSVLRILNRLFGTCIALLVKGITLIFQMTQQRFVCLVRVRTLVDRTFPDLLMVHWVCGCCVRKLKVSPRLDNIVSRRARWYYVLAIYLSFCSHPRSPNDKLSPMAPLGSVIIIGAGEFGLATTELGANKNQAHLSTRSTFDCMESQLIDDDDLLHVQAEMREVPFYL